MDYYQLLKTDYTWQNLSINEIHKILYGESSKKISGYDNSNGCNVIVFGPPQIGKTTLILYLLGIDENYVTIHHKKFTKNRHYPLFKKIQM